jgi:phenylacetate-CoA ligase
MDIFKNNVTFLPEIEKRSLQEIIHFQDRKLSELLNYLNNNSKFYKDLFRKNHIDLSKINGVKDLKNIPFTTKDDLQSRNEDFLCVHKTRIIDYITTSGTLGKPVTFAQTDSDLDRLAYNEAISFVCAGGKPESVYQLITTLDRRFMAGLAYFLGLRKLGAGVIRVGSGMPELQWESIERFKPDTFVTVPSFLIKLIEFAEANGIDYKNSSLKSAVCIGEPLRNADLTFNTLGKRITEKWDLKLYSTYASTEMGTAFTECSYGVGGHHHPELIIVEVIDDNGNQVCSGEAGEVTVTTLGVEGMPLLRFKTGDICHYYTEPCKCGRNTLRLGPVIGRKQQMIKYKGTTIYPPSLFDILDDITLVENYIVEVATNKIDTDNIRILVNCNCPGDEIEQIVKDRFRAKLRVMPEVEFIDAKEMNEKMFPAGSRKPVKFIDKR